MEANRSFEPIRLAHLFCVGVGEDAIVVDGAHQEEEADPHEGHEEVTQQVDHLHIAITLNFDILVVKWNWYHHQQQHFGNELVREDRIAYVARLAQADELLVEEVEALLRAVVVELEAADPLHRALLAEVEADHGDDGRDHDDELADDVDGASVSLKIQWIRILLRVQRSTVRRQRMLIINDTKAEAKEGHHSRQKVVVAPLVEDAMVVFALLEYPLMLARCFELSKLRSQREYPLV